MKLMFLLVVLAASLTGCGDNQAPEEAIALLARVQEANYRSWERAPGYAMRRPTSAPHGEEVDIYINTVLAEATRQTGLTEWPVGSLVVKDGFDGALDVIAVMEKRETGWFFAEYDADGDALFSGQPQVCLNCHGGAGILAFPLP